MAKNTLVTLACEALGERNFEISHAERLLSIKNNGGWYLNDKNFELKEDGTIVRRSKKEDNGK